ncbi:hypothetical protein [Streptacidiphilus albus]|uniref:hypothetical protein n=1 Tax=Streptacidiphilus albus TaxID=105425 RepID=UPI00054B83D6|nr:hypothetical protein [Streptacidiphilus albus]
MDQRSPVLAHPRPPAPPNRAPRYRGGCAAVALVACLALVLGALYLWHTVHDYLDPPAPDVTAARSSVVNDADLGATNSLNDEAARLQQILPWIHPVARGVDDGCSAQVEGEAVTIGGRPTWGPVSCDRELDWFGSLDGPLPPQLTRMNSALVKAGLTPQGSPLNAPYAFGSVSSTYGDGNITVNVVVAPSDDLGQISLTDGGVLVPTGGSGPSSPEQTDTAVRTLTRVKSAQLASAAGPQGYVVSLNFTTTYYTAPADSAGASPTPPESGGGCVTGAYCVGG